ncbi:unnamed protein product, partial [Amoebophrya sp. A25]
GNLPPQVVQETRAWLKFARALKEADTTRDELLLPTPGMIQDEAGASASRTLIKAKRSNQDEARLLVAQRSTKQDQADDSSRLLDSTFSFAAASKLSHTNAGLADHVASKRGASMESQHSITGDAPKMGTVEVGEEEEQDHETDFPGREEAAEDDHDREEEDDQTAAGLAEDRAADSATLVGQLKNLIAAEAEGLEVESILEETIPGMEELLPEEADVVKELRLELSGVVNDDLAELLIKQAVLKVNQERLGDSTKNSSGSNTDIPQGSTSDDEHENRRTRGGGPSADEQDGPDRAGHITTLHEAGMAIARDEDLRGQRFRQYRPAGEKGLDPQVVLRRGRMEGSTFHDDFLDDLVHEEGGDCVVDATVAAVAAEIKSGGSVRDRKMAFMAEVQRHLTGGK